MDACVCSVAQRLAKDFNETEAKDLVPALNCHLRNVYALLAKSKTLARDIQYRITPNTQRTSKALFVDSVDLAPVNRVCERFDQDIDGFWTTSDDLVHAELRRRLACVVIFLRSKLDAEAPVPLQIGRLFQGQQNYLDLRNSGRKYIKISRKLGGIGSIFWLPLDIPPSTYERYLNIDDEDVFSHLNSLGPQSKQYMHLVQRLILSQLREPTLSCSYFNLAVDYNEVITPGEELLLLLHALGGSEIPDVLLRSVRCPQRRWNANGEIEGISATEFGLPFGLINALSDDIEYAQIVASSYIIKHLHDDGTVSWSVCPEMRSFFNQALLPQTLSELGTTALKFLCFACPPCYEGNTTWSPALKTKIWPILENTLKANRLETSLRTKVLEAVLYFAERDTVAIRRCAVDQAKAILRKPMPYYLHASVVLFRSILYRLGGELAKSEAQIREFLWRGPKPVTRRDYALAGRLHISQTENKIKCYDNDVPSFIYKWEASQPLSTLDIEVTFRLQSAAARFFQSVGDFGAARASLEQFLSLNTANPMRPGTRRVIVGRLADIYCEMGEYSKVVEIVQPELGSIAESDRLRRPFRRLLLALVEANIGLGNLDAAESVLHELEEGVPLQLDDLHDQLLNMRRLIAAARISHLRCTGLDAVVRWRNALQEVERMYTLKSKGGFTAALIYLSMAHAQLTTGDRNGGRNSWVTGVDILRSEKCEFWIPIVPTIWLQSIAKKVYQLQGWSLRMMLPGGKPDITWP